MHSSTQERPVVIVGGGLAGLFTALKLAPLPVILITPRTLGEGASSAWAQAGIAAAIGEGDSFDTHTVDTLTAGAGLCDETAVRSIVSEAPERIEDLLRYGVPFDRDLEGRLRQSREGAHSQRRVIGVRGDQAGLAIMVALTTALRATPSIRVWEGVAAHDLAVSDGAVTGVFYTPVSSIESGGGNDSGDSRTPPAFLAARAVVLATGGIGQLFALTTNPVEARGEGLAMAARAGAVIADPEFVQFHPTAIAVGKNPAPLATEALRGEGATLINKAGERFMLAVHPDAELAPRDVVARAVHQENTSGRGAFLDCREAVGDAMSDHFPTVYSACMAAGIDPTRQPIPVAPAAHYHMGGVMTGMDARTSLPGLWAVGEVTCTGVHGANRLASNSLLEAVVMGARAAEAIVGLSTPASATPLQSPPLPDIAAPLAAPYGDASALLHELQSAMAQHVGMERDRAGLISALGVIERIAAGVAGTSPLGNMVEVARFVVVAALQREESRGSHYRTDYRETATEARRGLFTREAVISTAAKILGSR
ncbi:MAG: L-aspartate oxidase [Alphaproteobacteria bacterium]